MKSYKFLTTCVSSTAEDIDHMLEHPSCEQVDYDELSENVSDDELAAVFPMYGNNPNEALTLETDWAVSYWKSIYQGKLCYYVDHSRIEHIFVK